MNSKMTARAVAGFNSGLLTATEVADGMLRDFLSDADNIDEVQAVMATLPEGVREALFELLGDIKRADYHWSPFWIGPGGNDPDPVKLRQVSEMLGVV